jgi:hypothetical protein
VVGPAAVLAYLVLTVAAIALYPGSTSPADIYLSDLGNAVYSPDGWALYDLAMILGGLLSIPFFVGASRFFMERGSRRLARAGMALGIVNGIAVVMAGAVAEHVHLGVHIGWSLLIFASFIPLLAVYGVLLWRIGGFARAVSAYGSLVCAVDLGLLAALFASGPVSGLGSIMEWVAVFAYLAWVGLASLGLHLLLTRPPIRYDRPTFNRAL